MRVFGKALFVSLVIVMMATKSSGGFELTDKAETWLKASDAEKKDITMKYAKSFPESRGKSKGAAELVAMIPETCLNQYLGPKSNIPKNAQQAMLEMTYEELFPICFAAMKKGFEAEFGR